MGMLALLQIFLSVKRVAASCGTTACPPAFNIPSFNSGNLFNWPSVDHKPKNQKDCRPYLQAYIDGKYLWEHCIRDKVCEVAESCESPKTEDLQLLLTYFQVLQQFIIFETAKYDKALKECDLYTMFMIARFQFEIMFSEAYISIQKCKEELLKPFSGCIKIVAKDNCITIEHEKFYPCVIPKFLIDPQELFLVPREIDLDCFELIIIQIRRNRLIRCEEAIFKKMCELFYGICGNLYHRQAIIRVKIFLILLITDLRTNRFDCTLAKYIGILRYENNDFCTNIDPACKYLFGIK